LSETINTEPGLEIFRPVFLLADATA